MQFNITGGVDPLLTVSLEKGEKVLAESNAMVAMDGNLRLEGKSRGGIMKSLARKFLNDETFFQQFIEADKGPGVALLAPNIPGDIRLLDVGARQYMISDGAFLAAESGVELEVKSQGLGRALLGDSGGFFVMATQGNGRVAVSGFGSVRELDVTPDKPLIVDNGHLVAWDAGLDYELSINTSRSGLLGKLVNSQITGEGVVLKFRGTGKVIVCSRNKGGFLDWIFANSPTAKAAQNS
jgi:uncharacterized protein (TIGR00266 family)